MDADEGNVVCARQNLALYEGQVRFFHANYALAHQVLAEVGWDKVDVLLADLGVASNQLDDPARGMSFSKDGPLDMRLDRSSPSTAADFVNQMGQKELADLIYTLGEERYSRRIARAIVEERQKNRINRTGQLEEIIFRAVPAAVRQRRKGVHPATRTFQALRIAVNDELRNLDTLLGMLGEILAPGGRAGFISFHSLEDRRVKQAFADLAQAGSGKLLSRKPITASEAEIQNNPRSRSAKLRGIEIFG
jgi:16S rRNA (cytosine1402-N4)-methyltransferase